MPTTRVGETSSEKNNRRRPNSPKNSKTLDDGRESLSQFISDAIKNNILEMLHSSKYSIIFDTTSDINHTEQLTIVIRFVYHNKSRNVAEIREQFLGFQSVTGTASVGLFEFIINHLKLINSRINKVI